MKTLLTLTAIALLAATEVKAQKKYYQVELKSIISCDPNPVYSSQWVHGNSPTIESSKSELAKWVSPNKVKSVEIVKLKQITKAEFFKSAKPVKFKCPEPIKWIFDGKLTTSLIDTGRLITSPYLGISTIKPTGHWHFGAWADEKPILRAQMLYKDSLMYGDGPVDSIRIHVKKSQLRWVNDSTAIIRKP